MKLVQVPRDSYGKFHSGDSYLIYSAFESGKPCGTLLQVCIRTFIILFNLLNVTSLCNTSDELPYACAKLYITDNIFAMTTDGTVDVSCDNTLSLTLKFMCSRKISQSVAIS